MFKSIDESIIKIEGFALSSPYGEGKSLGQPKGVKSIGFVRIFSESGEYGVGETYAGVYSPELISPIIEFLENYLVGKLVGDDQLLEKIYHIPFIGRNGIIRSIASAIEIALWDLRGKILETPAHILLNNNSQNNHVQMYASGGTVVFSPKEIQKDVEEVISLGYSAYKMRVGYQSWDEDISRVQEAKKIIGDGSLMVDAIMGTIQPAWEFNQAKNNINDLLEFDLKWLEEPLHPDNTKGLEKLSNLNLIPIAAGEAYTGISEYQSLIDNKAVDILQFDATHSGGMAACVDLAEKAKSVNIESAVHVWGSAVAISANANVALANSYISYLEMPMVNLEITKHMWNSPPNIISGVWHKSSEPGLGVNLDDKLIEKYKFQHGSGYRLP
jgi:L-alanine-DL-glutamate epimerase-like enolase superfamily enzyme